MDVREKLVELLEELCVDYGATAIFFTSEEAEVLADHLIAHGVTVQSDKDINVPNKWISVKDRLPEKKGGYIVCTDKGGILLSHWYGNKWGGGYASKHITHWMNKPEPPKGE